MRQATNTEEKMIAEIDMLTANIKQFAILRDEIFEKLAAKTMGDPVLCNGEMIVVGKPKGKWIGFSDWGFVIRRKAPRA